MAKITMAKFSSNILNLRNNMSYLLEKQVFDIMEPMVYQYILRTRIDTGAARKALGVDFLNLVSSARIKRSTEYDTEVSHAVYNWWNYMNDRSFISEATPLITKNLVSIQIRALDEGLSNQKFSPPSPLHPRTKNTLDRFPIDHIKNLSDVFNHSDLQNITNGLIVPTIAKDLKIRIEKLLKKIELEMFRG